jgi:hypothetical protein
MQPWAALQAAVAINPFTSPSPILYTQTIAISSHLQPVPDFTRRFFFNLTLTTRSTLRRPRAFNGR